VKNCLFFLFTGKIDNHAAKAAPEYEKQRGRFDFNRNGAAAPNSFMPYNICANEFAPTFLDSSELYFKVEGMPPCWILGTCQLG
jgi:hypothetical protein